MKRLLTAIFACALLSLTGCVSYSNHELASVGQWPPTASKTSQSSAYINVNTQYLFNDQPRAGGFNQAQLEALILKQYRSSDRFSSVITAKQAADLYITIDVSNHERGSLFSAVLTGLTLFVIPGRYTNELTMETTFKDVDGKVLGRIKKHETITTWMQLLMVFALPFNESADNILTQLTQSTLEAAAQQKLI